MGHGYNGGICEKFLFFRFRRGFSCKWWRWGEIDFETLDIESSNENDESKINEKDEETVTLDDPITNETKEVPAVIIDWFVILKTIKKVKKWLLSNMTGQIVRREKSDEIFSRRWIIFSDENFPRQGNPCVIILDHVAVTIKHWNLIRMGWTKT